MQAQQLERGLIEASGYMDLGMPVDADETLAALPNGLQSHPAVMTARIGALLAAGSWENARQIAARLTDCMEEHVQHWIWWAYARRRAESGGGGRGDPRERPSSLSLPFVARGAKNGRTTKVDEKSISFQSG